MITAQSMGMKMPIGRTPKAGRGSILEVHTSHINPGRAEDAAGGTSPKDELS